MPEPVCGYDIINYDQSFYDCQSFADVDVLLSFAWGLEPLPEDDDMASKISYELTLQGTDPDGLIKTQADVSDDLALSADILSDDTYSIPAGAIDFPLHVINSDIDVLALVPRGGVVTAKINGITGTPFNIKKLMFLDGQGVSAVYISNPNQQVVTLRAIMAAE